ncbi:MAG: hypothetical protein L0Y58_18810 [Verrucomicrobia subdivision 3 bacterium]|nr:hypothetical protein [Limisphaerales bacterium]
MRLLFYSHDGLGLGHTRRHLAIAGALTCLAPECSVLLASGADDAVRMGLPPRVEILKLPGLRKVANDQYFARRLRVPAQDIRALRSALLLTAVKSFRPHVILVDKHPFGVNGELRHGLEVVRARGGRTVLGLRDILDDRATVLNEWAPNRLQEQIARHYDLMLVYGEQAVFDPLVEYDFPPSMAARTRFCGYVVNREEPVPRVESGEWRVESCGSKPVVLATTGGGEDGFFLLENFIRAADNAPWDGLVAAGPMTPVHELKTLQSLAAQHQVALRTFVPSLSSLFGSVDALVCMGGYNTLAEAAAKGVPTVCVPRMAPRSEQFLRSRAFERLGVLRTLRPERLNVAALREAVDEAVRVSRADLLARAQTQLRFDGATQAARHLLALGRRITKSEIRSPKRMTKSECLMTNE